MRKDALHTRKYRRAQVCQDFSQWLSSRRKTLSLSQQDLEDLTGIYRARLSELERGLVEPSLWEALQLQDVFGDLGGEVEQKRSCGASRVP